MRNKKKDNLLCAVIILAVWVVSGIGLVCVNSYICNNESKQDAEELCKILNDNSLHDAEVYKLKSGTGMFKHTKYLPVFYVWEEEDEYAWYVVINDGKIMVKNGVAEWFHNNGVTEVISDVVITKAK